jgi:hypothetical protein
MFKVIFVIFTVFKQESYIISNTYSMYTLTKGTAVTLRSSLT